MSEMKKRELAWIGDSVLALFSREWILRQEQIAPEARTAAFVSMTSNQFLACIGEPTEVEARIGRCYRDHGLEAAFNWITEHCLPLWIEQQANRRKSMRGKKGRSA
jgi:dsRNA-specific ribonuclease